MKLKSNLRVKCISHRNTISFLIIPNQANNVDQITKVFLINKSVESSGLKNNQYFLLDAIDNDKVSSKRILMRAQTIKL